MQRWLKQVRVALLVVVAVAMAVTAGAQEFRGTLSGTVADATGAVVPGTAIEVREAKTGTVNRTVTDAAGQYVVPFLLPGSYAITAKATGFQTVTQQNITLQAQEHPIVNLTLQVGDQGTTVTVTSAPPLVDQANASVGQVISTESVEQLPLNGRTPTTLTELSVGVITNNAPQLIHPFDNNAGNSWSIGGTPKQVSEVLLDGAPDLTLLGATAYSPTQDSVSEVSVRPFDTDASFGHTIGGVINQITRSGTNGLHGTVYEFTQVAALDANLWFNKSVTPFKQRPNTHFNQYGLTLGGPVVIPKLYNGRDKLFFFFAFEREKDSTPLSQQLTVPTQAERNGDFSQTLIAGCPGGFANNPAVAAAICNPDATHPKAFADPNQIYNPFTAAMTGANIVRQPIFNNNLASVQAANPVAAAYLALIPLPNTAGSSTGQNNYTSTAGATFDLFNNQFGRLDYNVSSRDHVFGDFRHNHLYQTKNNFFGNNATGTILIRENFGLTIDNVFTLNPTTIIDTRANWTLYNEVHGTPAQQYSAASVGLPANVSGAATEAQLPCINFLGTGGTSTTYSCANSATATSFASLGDNTSSFDPTTNYQAFTDVVKVLGKHTLKVGFDGRQYRLSVRNFGNAAGSFNFGTSFVTSGTGGTGQSFGGDLASFYFGLPTSGTFDNATRADYHTYYIGSFVQDDWRISDHLTLNLGVRYDIDTPFREKAGAIVNGFNPAATNSASAAAATAFKPTTVTANGLTSTVSSINTLGGLTFPGVADGAIYKNNSGFVSPRIGFSYSPQSSFVVRGGFGIFVQPESVSSLNSAGSVSSSAITDQEGFSSTTNETVTNNNFLTPATTFSNPYPNGFVAPAGSTGGASTFLGQSISFLAPYEHDAYSERWDLGVQKSLTSSTLLELLYVGNHSLHLPVATQNLNAARVQYLSTTPYRNQALAAAYGKSVANPFAGQLPNGGTANGATVAYSNLIYPYPQFGTAAVNIQNQTIGQSYYHSAIVHLEQRSKHGLTLTANYSFSKLTEADTFLNDEDAFLNHRVSPFDHTHHFTIGSTYALPFGKGKLFGFGGGRLADLLLGGFVVNGIYQFQTGAPVLFSADIPLQPGATPRSITIDKHLATPAGSGYSSLSDAVFVTGNSTTCPATGACDGSQFINGQYTFHYRTLPQTISQVRQDGFNNLDASLLKDFHITDGRYLQLRFEAFNALNHPAFAAPNVSSATASNFGYITSVFSNSQPRQIQLGARFVF